MENVCQQLFSTEGCRGFCFSLSKTQPHLINPINGSKTGRMERHAMLLSSNEGCSHMGLSQIRLLTAGLYGCLHGQLN